MPTGNDLPSEIGESHYIKLVKPLKKRSRRQIECCSNCRRRKIKCDKERPCGNCTRRQITHTCRLEISTEHEGEGVSEARKRIKMLISGENISTSKGEKLGVEKYKTDSHKYGDQGNQQINDGISDEKRHRSAPILSCAICRERKVKCDRSRPCSSCVERGIAHACTWDYHDNDKEAKQDLMKVDGSKRSSRETGSSSDRGDLLLGGSSSSFMSQAVGTRYDHPKTAAAEPSNFSTSSPIDDGLQTSASLASSPSSSTGLDSRLSASILERLSRLEAAVRHVESADQANSSSSRSNETQTLKGMRSVEPIDKVSDVASMLEDDIHRIEGNRRYSVFQKEELGASLRTGLGKDAEKLNSIQGYLEKDAEMDLMAESSYQEGFCGSPTINTEMASGNNSQPTQGKKSIVDEISKRLLKLDKTLFTLVHGSDTALGWGISWVFPAAEAAGTKLQYSQIKGCRGALQRESVLCAIIESLPSRETAMYLVNVFAEKVNFLAGNCVYMFSFKRELQAFYALESVEKQARVINFVDPAFLSLFLIILVLALHFHPSNQNEDTLHLFDGQTLHVWRSACHTVLILARYQGSTSILVLQTIILMHLHSSGTGYGGPNLIQIAIDNALTMGLHRERTNHDQNQKNDGPEAKCSEIRIRKEVARRVWYQLVYIDICLAPSRGGAYLINPLHYSVPLPSNFDNSDLCQSTLPLPKPINEYSEMSYPLAQYETALVMREYIDRTNAFGATLDDSAVRYLDNRLRNCLEKAASIYSDEPTSDEHWRISVERWLLQQSIFHQLLKLHRANLITSLDGRTKCVKYARRMLTQQRQTRIDGSIVNRLFLNLDQSFSPAIVLCIDLLHWRHSLEIRLEIREEVQEAIVSLQHVNSLHHSTFGRIQLLQILLKEEETQWNMRSIMDSNLLKFDLDVVSLVHRIGKELRQSIKQKNNDDSVQNTQTEGDMYPQDYYDQMMHTKLPHAMALPSFGYMAEYEYETSYPGITGPNGLDGAVSSHKDGQSFNWNNLLSLSSDAVLEGEPGSESVSSKIAQDASNAPVIDPTLTSTPEMDSFWSWILDGTMLDTNNIENSSATTPSLATQFNTSQTDEPKNPLFLLPQYQFTTLGVPSSEGNVIPLNLQQRTAFLPRSTSAAKTPTWLESPSILDTVSLFV